MGKRRPEVRTAPPGVPALQLDVFATAQPTPAELRARLETLARDVGRTPAGQTGGVTVADLRIFASAAGLTLPESPHFLGSIMRAAGGVATGETRRSTLPQSHGNRHTVWRFPPAPAAPPDPSDAPAATP